MMTALTNSDFTIGWISALEVELAAAIAMLDEVQADLPKQLNDHNTYTLGRIGKHNVVVAGWPAGSIGNNPALHAAANLVRSFPSIRCILLVGIGGGVPNISEQPMKDVRLGDVVVGSPDGTHGGVVQYDFGTSIQLEKHAEDKNIDQRQSFVRKGSLNKPPLAFPTALTKLRAEARIKGYKFGGHFATMLEKYPLMRKDYKRPVVDKLYKADYIHVHGDCSACSALALIEREAREVEGPVVHYGNIGSANQVVRDANMRDRLLKEEAVICFEMEAAGLMDLGCLVIRGICDYCDSHKKKDWQPYAGAIAAAYAKELLLTLPVDDVKELEFVSKIVATIENQTVVLESQHETVQNISNLLSQMHGVALSDADRQCLRCLNASDPALDKKRIEDLKGNLLRDSYKWVLHDEQFLTWRDTGGLLWIQGAPGKGKTMLMCGLIDELDKPVYFFCENANSTSNTASAVLRGLIYGVAQHSPGAIDSVRDKIFRIANLQEDNAWYLLVDIFEQMVSGLGVCVLVDGLDECLSHRGNLLKLICRTSRTGLIKWIVSSRPYQDIETQLRFGTKLSLDLKNQSVSSAVKTFIEFKTGELSETNDWTGELTLFVRSYMEKNAQSTFLWVALVCDNLRTTQPWEIKEALEKFPPGLEETYNRMLDIIEGHDVTSLLFKRILVVCSIVSRPVSLTELKTIMELPNGFENPLWLLRAITSCGSFIGVRDNMIEFVHETAQEFIQRRLLSSEEDVAKANHEICQRSIKTMLCNLRHNIYNIDNPLYNIKEIVTPNPDPLIGLRYACFNWPYHLCKNSLKSDVFQEFLNKSLFFWFEAASLLREVPIVISSLGLLEKQFNDDEEMIQLHLLVSDAVKFLQCFLRPISGYPLQVYFCGLVYSPAGSVIQKLAQQTQLTAVSSSFSTLRTWPMRGVSILTGVQDICCLAYSSAGQDITVGGSFGVVRVYDSLSGATLYAYQYKQNTTRITGEFSLQYQSHTDTLHGDAVNEQSEKTPNKITAIAMNSDTKQVVFVVEALTVCIWNLETNHIDQHRYHSMSQEIIVNNRATLIAYILDAESFRVCRPLVKESSLIIPGSFTPASKFCFSSRGDSVAVQIEEDSVGIVNTDTAAVIVSKSIRAGLRLDAIALRSSRLAMALVGREDDLHHVIVMDLLTSNVLWLLDKSCSDFCMSPDERYIWLHSGQVYSLYDTSHNQARLDLIGFVTPTFSQSSTILAVARKSGAIDLLDLMFLKPDVALDADHELCEWMFVEEGSRLIVRYEDMTQIWNVRDGTVQWLSRDLKSPFTELSEDGSSILQWNRVSCDFNVWRLQQDGFVACHRLKLLDEPAEFSISPNGVFVWFIQDNQDKIWNVALDTIITLPGEICTKLDKLWSLDSANFLAVGGQEPQIFIWAAKSGRLLFQTSENCATCSLLHTACKSKLLQLIGNQLVVSQTICNTVSVWNIDHCSRESITVSEAPYLMSWLTVGKTLVTFSTHQKMMVWEIPSGRCIAKARWVPAIKSMHCADSTTIVTNIGEILFKDGQLRMGSGLLCCKQLIFKDREALGLIPESYGFDPVFSNGFLAIDTYLGGLAVLS